MEKCKFSFIFFSVLLITGCAKKTEDPKKKSIELSPLENMVELLQVPSPDQAYNDGDVSTSSLQSTNPVTTPSSSRRFNSRILLRYIDELANPLVENKIKLKSFSKSSKWKSSEVMSVDVLSSSLKSTPNDDGFDLDYSINGKTYFVGTMSKDGKSGQITVLTDPHLEAQWSQTKNKEGKIENHLVLRHVDLSNTLFFKWKRNSKTGLVIASMTGKVKNTSLNSEWGDSGGYLQESNFPKICWDSKLINKDCD